MAKVMKGIAIAALVATIAGACAVLYGINMLVPQAELATLTVTPAAQAPQMLESVLAQVESGTFAGHVFSDTDGVTAENASFVTVQVRLNNRGFFPAEWIALSAVPRHDAGDGTRDVLQLDNYGANVLAPGSRGDISATVLTTMEPGKHAVQLEVSCYVLGRLRTFSVSAQ